MPSSLGAEQRVTYLTTGDEASRLYVKKTIVVGNVSKYVIRLEINSVILWTCVAAFFLLLFFSFRGHKLLPKSDCLCD